ncbi:MAG: IS110 family transposase [Thermoguttaceae bacterium]|jgi:transposase
MLYIGIDLHGKQMTVNIRDEGGTVIQRRQVSTRPAKVEKFFEQVHGLEDGNYVVLLEVCGFHDWLVDRLRADEQCREVVLIQPERISRRKTDRRDANHLGELLWVNRERLLAGEKVQGVRRVYIPTDAERQDRQITSIRYRLAKQRTRTLNQIHHILRRNNLEWDLPTKGFQTKKVKDWLKTLSLEATDRLELDQLLEQWAMWDEQIVKLEWQIAERCHSRVGVQLLTTIVGVSYYMALAIVSRIGDIPRFPSGRSLANFLGLTPSSRSSGEKQSLGSITKQGSRMVRFLLGQLVLHVLRKDAKLRAWYAGIKRRRGSKVARVAVMRRMAVIIWHMLSKQEAYVYGGEPSAMWPRNWQLAKGQAACGARGQEVPVPLLCRK